MDSEKPPIKLTGRQFEKLIYSLRNTGVNRTLLAKEIINEVCPLVPSHKSMRPFAINCLKLPSQDQRKDHCKNFDCPLLSQDEFIAEVTRSKGNPHLYYVDPINGLVRTTTQIKNKPNIEKLEDIQEDIKSENYSKSIEKSDIIGIEDIHRDALIKIFSAEYSHIWRSKRITIPNPMNRIFIEGNTDFKYLFTKNSKLPIPIDTLSMELAGWKYINPLLSIDSLAQSSSSLPSEVQLREPLYDSLVQEINIGPFPYQNYIEYKRTFDEI